MMPDLLGFAPDHVAGGVLQVDDRHVGLAAKLDELRCLAGAVGVDRAVVADQADGMALDLGLAADGVRTVRRLEVEIVGIIDDARDHFAHVVGLAIVDRHDAGEFLRGVARLLEGFLRQRRQCCSFHGNFAMISRAMRTPSASSSARYSPSPETVACMSAPPSSSSAGDLAGGGAQERRTGQEHFRPAAYQDHIVGQPRQIGAARRRRSVHDRDLRNAGSRQACLIGKTAAALDEHFRLIEQIGAAGFHELDHRQLVSHRDLLHAQMLLDAHRGDRAAFDGAVVGGHDAANAGDITDAGDTATALDAGIAVVVVHAKAGERRELEPGRARIEQKRDALARQQLLARAEAFAPCVRGVAHLLFERAKFADQRQHLLAI